MFVMYKILTDNCRLTAGGVEAGFIGYLLQPPFELFGCDDDLPIDRGSVWDFIRGPPIPLCVLLLAVVSLRPATKNNIVRYKSSTFYVQALKY